MLVELRQFGIGQALDALLDLAAFDAEGGQLVLYPLVVQHGQQLLAVDLLLLGLQYLRGADHRRLGDRHLGHQQQMGCRQQHGQPTGKCSFEHLTLLFVDRL
ncbi:hypothetical protein D3C73_1478990 [compost metagenome]